MERPGLLVVIVRRHILRWLPSVHASPFELSSTMQRMNFSDFIRAEWTPVWRVERNGEQIEKPAYEDYDPEQKRRFENALSMRSAKLRYFDETASMPVNVVLTRFEDVNMAPERWLSEVAETFAITPSKSFTGVGRYRGGAPGAYRPRVFRRIAPPDRKFILGNVDTEAEEQAGYVLADTPAFDGLGMFDRRSIRGVVRYLRKGPA